MLKNQSLAAKIFSLGLVMTLIMVGIVSITIWQVRNAQEINDRVIALRAPTARTSVALLNGVNHSLAALRGWIILANPVFKQERADAWGEIEKNLAAMRDYSRNWTNPENVRRLKEIDGLFGDFRNYQKEIEDIANTPDNTPASKILIQEAAPKAAVLAAEITNMIDAEAPLPATAERKALFAMMADVRGTLGLSLGAIRAYLLSGDEKFQEEFEKLWEKNEIRFTDLSGNRQLLSPEQAMSFDTFSAARDEFKVLPPRMFEIRGSEKWNVANHLLRTKAAPTALRIKENLDAMAEDQKKLMDQDTILAHETNTRLIWLLVIIAIVAALAALALSLAITRSITAPLNRISEVLRDNSTQVASASGQISASSQSLAEASTEQASSLEETSASLEQMSSQTRANADNAQEANSLAATTRQEAESGSQTMKEMIGSMDAINK